MSLLEAWIVCEAKGARKKMMIVQKEGMCLER